MQSLLRGFVPRGAAAGAGTAAAAAAAAHRHVIPGREHSVSTSAATVTSHTEIHEIDAADGGFELISNAEINDALHILVGADSGCSSAATEHLSDSDTESTVSFGAEADRHLEAPVAGVHSVLSRVLRNAEVQFAVLGALREDPDFAHIIGDPAMRRIEHPVGGDGRPEMLPASAQVVWVQEERAADDPLGELLNKVGTGLVALGAKLAAAGDRLGQLFQSLGASLRRTMERAQEKSAEAEDAERSPGQQRAVVAGAIFQVAVGAIVLILCRRAGFVRFAAV